MRLVIVDSDLTKALRRERGIHTSPWRHFPRLIVSIETLKRERPMAICALAPHCEHKLFLTATPHNGLRRG